jgi:hypothetical protein
MGGRRRNGAAYTVQHAPDWHVVAAKGHTRFATAAYDCYCWRAECERAAVSVANMLQCAGT